MRTTTFRSDWLVALLAGALVAPALLGAQPAATGTRSHVVKAGETLWRIAQDSLGDGHRWTEILSLNREHVTSPNQLETGLRLVLPPRARRSAATRSPSAPMGTAARGESNRASAPRNAGGQRPPAVSKPAAPPAGGGARKTVAVKKPGPPQAAVEHPGVLEAASPAPGAPTMAGRSIFFGKEPGAAPPPAMSLGADTIGPEVAPPAPVRAWEYVSAPFVLPAEWIAIGVQGGASRGAPGTMRPGADAMWGAGRCLAFSTSGDSAGGASSVVRYGDRMVLAPPEAVPVSAGDRLLAAHVGPQLEGLGTVMVPTGIVRVDSGGAGTATRATVLAQFGTMSCSDQLFPLALPADTTPAHPVPVSNGATGEVVWIGSSALLPSLQYDVIVNLGTLSGVKPGDQVTLLGPVGEDTAALHSGEIAVATVLRVGLRTATAKIIRRQRGDIAPGMPVRVSAKLP